MSDRMRGAATILLAVVLIAIAFVVRLTQPSDEQQQAPFVSYASIGELAQGRDITWLARDAYLADRVTAPGWVGETDGVWLVVEGEIGSRVGTTSPDVSILIGDTRYYASDRPDRSALGGSLAAGLPQGGAFVFELPGTAIEGPDAAGAVARFATGFRVRLDSAIDMRIDLTELDRRDTVALQEPGLVLP